MKKFFCIIAIFMLVLTPFCLTACGNVLQNWTEVSSISYNYSTTRSSHYSKVYFEYTQEHCTAQEYNSGDKLLEQNLGGTALGETLNFDIGVDEKKSFVNRASQHVGKVYYAYISGTREYYKYSITGFYSAIIKVKLYVNHYVEITTIYHDYVGVTTKHQDKTIGVNTEDYTINYFN